MAPFSKRLSVPGQQQLHDINTAARERLSSVDTQDGASTEAEQKQEQKPAVAISQRSSFKNLFAFTLPKYRWIVFCAFLTAAVIAGGRTAYAVILGKMFEFVTSYGAGVIDEDYLLTETSRWCVYLCFLGIGLWVFYSLDMALWVLTGELRARTTRNVLFTTLLNKNAQWYDLREHGLSSLLVGIQT